MGNWARFPYDEVEIQNGMGGMFLDAAVSEGFCDAVFEAQVMRLLVISSDAVALSENVEHGETGYIVSRRAPISPGGEKWKCLPRMLRCAEKCKVGRKRIEARFSLGGQIEALEQFCTQILIYLERQVVSVSYE